MRQIKDINVSIEIAPDIQLLVVSNVRDSCFKGLKRRKLRRKGISIRPKIWIGASRSLRTVRDPGTFFCKKLAFAALSIHSNKAASLIVAPDKACLSVAEAIHVGMAARPKSTETLSICSPWRCRYAAKRLPSASVSKTCPTTTRRFPWNDANGSPTTSYPTDSKFTMAFPPFPRQFRSKLNRISRN